MREIIKGEGVAVLSNAMAVAPADRYGEVRSSILSVSGFDAAQKEITQWPGYLPTALHCLSGLAQTLGLGELYYKDESTRFTLKSFKALGGAYAVFRLIQQAIAKEHNGHMPSPEEVLSGKYKDIVSKLTVTCATDGNHGRSVAWGAQTFGCGCVIYVHAMVSQGRADAIAAFGAKVERVAGNYDESVRHAAEQAEKHGWTVVSDTTYEGYRDIPIDVMHGYGVMSREMIEQLDDVPPTHVIVQAGVGAFAASVCAVFWQHWGEQRPRFVVVEPENAACLFESAKAGHPVAVHGELDTVMAGLACGEVSPVAWEILAGGANDFCMLADHYALEGMKVFANPVGSDPAIVSGETGTTGLGLLMAAKHSPAVWQALRFGPDARVLILGSEGDTDPEIYAKVVGRKASEVVT
ncbi:diaminopropionate ammonia-lyase [Orrella daihaiensis]|uniref:Diaminopropionate ammonia-lyase n=1 Tax=Orrella daihaiensis TaxID=2782176 RepID=A0ABY4AKE5_9BURK|nr:diaminopropionate ammonia-lyase [Orrella daihaiensis]UOD50742.1 diaminopropionate ammonia-lyase [Orrella daihaiensis]